MVPRSLFQRYPLTAQVTYPVVPLPNRFHRNLLSIPEAFLATELSSEWLTFPASVTRATMLTNKVAAHVRYPFLLPV